MFGSNLNFTGSYNPYGLIQQNGGKRRYRKSNKCRKSNKRKRSKQCKRKTRKHRH